MSDEKNARCLLGTVGIRGLDPHSQAVKLVKEHGVSQGIAAQVCGLSKRQVQRAKASFEKGRDLGVQGRPKLFNYAEEQVLVNIIDKAEAKQKNITFKQFQEHVSFIFYFFLNLSHISHLYIYIKVQGYLHEYTWPKSCK